MFWRPGEWFSREPVRPYGTMKICRWLTWEKGCGLREIDRLNPSLVVENILGPAKFLDEMGGGIMWVRASGQRTKEVIRRKTGVGSVRWKQKVDDSIRK
jgi:hypothetical protein